MATTTDEARGVSAERIAYAALVAADDQARDEEAVHDAAPRSERLAACGSTQVPTSAAAAPVVR